MEKWLHIIIFLLTSFGTGSLCAQTTIQLDSALEKKLFYQRGKASYYHPSLEGMKTANGERYRQKKLTAAHLTLPFGTKVKVTNVKTKKWVIVTINDRGPYSKKYIIDLSYRAAKHLGMTNGKGFARVRIEEVVPKERFWQQNHVPELPGQGLKK
jgi:rare lipoprotein A